MVEDIKKNWEVGLVDCPDTAKATLIVKIHGGQSVTVKSLAASGQKHTLYPSSNFTSGTGYELAARETQTFSLPKSFGEDNILEVYANPSQAGDDMCFAKIIDEKPVFDPSEQHG